MSDEPHVTSDAALSPTDAVERAYKLAISIGFQHPRLLRAEISLGNDRYAIRAWFQEARQ